MQYPNIQLIAETFCAVLREKTGITDIDPHQIRYTAFLQLWPNTATGLAQKGDFAGQAFTDAYTTIASASVDGKRYYGVFFDNKPAYLVTDPPQRFFEDMKKHRLASVAEAEELY